MSVPATPEAEHDPGPGNKYHYLDKKANYIKGSLNTEKLDCNSRKKASVNSRTTTIGRYKNNNSQDDKSNIYIKEQYNKYWLSQHTHKWKTKIGQIQHIKGTTINKKSKYRTSTTYFCPISEKGRRPLLLDKIKKINMSFIGEKENKNNWILCARNFVPKSTGRKINPIQPIPKHQVLITPQKRRWATAILSDFIPTTYNYYEPLAQFAHYHEPEIEMARDKAKVAVDMRQRMMSLRAGEITTKQATAKATSPGRGGGVTGGGTGRGGASLKHRGEKQTEHGRGSNQQEVTSKTNEQGEKMNIQTTNKQIQNDETPTMSDLTEDTTQEQEEMETEEDILVPISLTNVPKEIKKFCPNTQWTRDLERNLTKRKYGIEIKITPDKSPKETENPPSYSHVRIFNAVATAILTAAPGTAICSIDDNEESIVNTEDIPTTQKAIDNYLESPMVNNKTFTYHARIHISCIKPLFIIMKNENLMKWLQKNKIFIEENDLETTLPSMVGILFFVHPKLPLLDVYQEQLKAMFIGKPIPEFKIRRYKVKSGEESAYVILIQTVQDKAQEVSRQFEEVNDKNPYEFVSWRAWLNLHSSNKVATIKTHNEYLQNVQVLNLPGFRDDNTTLMGKVEQQNSPKDYSEYSLNEFIQSYYYIDDDTPMFTAVLGPFLGKRLFVLPSKLATAGSRLLESLQVDILRHMTPAAGNACLENYQEKAQKMQSVSPWKPTWLEKQILTMKPEENEGNQHGGKRKKTSATTTESTKDTSNIHHSHTQNATKVLSEVASTESLTRIDIMEQRVASLQESNVELMSMIGEMKEIQHRDQTKIIGLQSDIEEANRKSATANQEIRKCKAAVANVETRLASLTTKEETYERLDRIEQMIAGISGINSAMAYKHKQITGKRKDTNSEIEGKTTPDEVLYTDKEDYMESESTEPNQKILLLEEESSDDHTNNRQGANTQHMRVK
jgi:hypothetical protein